MTICKFANITLFHKVIFTINDVLLKDIFMNPLRPPYNTEFTAKSLHYYCTFVQLCTVGDFVTGRFNKYLSCN